MDADVPGYVLHERLAAGVGTTVDRGEQIATSRPVAVKRVRAGADQDVRASFRRELAALRSVQHPNVVEVVDVVERDDEVAIVQPLMARTLADRLAAEGPLSPIEAAELGADLARGLAALHAAGVLHRDVKPSNVLIDHEGVPRLGDLGVALVRDDDRAGIVGTAEYVDPEVAAGGPDGPAADLYGLGVTLYEAIAGVPPFAGSTVLATLRAADRGIHVPLRDAASTAPPSLCAAVERAMARAPERRWPSADTFAAALDAARLDALGAPHATAGHGGAPHPGAPDAADRGATTTPPPPPAPRRRPDAVPVARSAPTGAAVGTADLRGERSGGTRHFGARPAAPTPAPGGDGGGDPPPRWRRPWLIALIAAVVTLPLIAVGVVLAMRDRDPRPDGSPVVATSADAPPGAAALEACDGVAEPTPPEGGEVLRGDLTGAGCATFVVWADGVLEVLGAPGEPAARFAVGEPTDRLVLGDWDCDGVDTPGVYRPSDGQVFLFDGLATGDGELTSRPGYPSGRPGGAPTAADVDADGCDEVVVEPAG